jgi:hypothetical protein
LQSGWCSTWPSWLPEPWASLHYGGDRRQVARRASQPARAGQLAAWSVSQVAGLQVAAFEAEVTVIAGRITGRHLGQQLAGSITVHAAGPKH